MALRLYKTGEQQVSGPMYRVKDLLRGPRPSPAGERGRDNSIYLFALLIEALITVDIVMYIFLSIAPRENL